MEHVPAHTHEGMTQEHCHEEVCGATECCCGNDKDGGDEEDDSDHHHKHEHNHEHDHEDSCGCGVSHNHEHEHEHNHEDSCGCGHEHHHEEKHITGKHRVYVVHNLDCANCGAKIERALNKMAEIDEAVLTFTTKKLKVKAASYEGLLEKMQAVTDSVENGVVLTELSESFLSAPNEKTEASIAAKFAEKQQLVEIILGGLVFIATEWLGLIPEAYHLYFLVFAYVLLGGRIVWNALKNITKGRVFDENFLMTVATLGAFAIKAWEEAVGVMFFYRLGEFFEQRAVEKSRGQIMEAVDMRPQVVNLLVGDKVEVIGAEAARVGDILLVRVGDRIPLDGVVVEGESLVDTSPVTGEPVPVKRKNGDEVVSGCVNTSGMLKIRVEKVLEESMVTKILDSVENAAASKPAIDRFITRFARVYTPFVVAAAVLTAVIPSLVTGEWEKWIYTCFNIFVISCPLRSCAQRASGFLFRHRRRLQVRHSL
ncbi:heavy metal transporting P-type ATPase [gut metagenome]|uniref:Heavy metal transporting P-type ATPase n=1 Tax=gut metagenome TaxID=749906 RepID=J9GXA0_9ZZZZ